MDDTIPLKIEFEAVAPLIVLVDQRDLAAVELTDYLDTTLTRMRWLAWHCATRTKAYIGSWEKFNAEAVSVGDPDTGAVPPDPAEPNPTRRGAGAAS